MRLSWSTSQLQLAARARAPSSMTALLLQLLVATQAKPKLQSALTGGRYAFAMKAVGRLFLV
jgi:hypothetical protein